MQGSLGILQWSSLKKKWNQKKKCDLTEIVRVYLWSKRLIMKAAEKLNQVFVCFR